MASSARWASATRTKQYSPRRTRSGRLAIADRLMPRPERCSNARSSTPARSSGGTRTNMVRSAPVGGGRGRADDDEAGLGAGEVLDAEGDRLQAPARRCRRRRQGHDARLGALGDDPARLGGRGGLARRRALVVHPPPALGQADGVARRHPHGGVVTGAPEGAERDGQDDLLADLDPLGVVHEHVDGEVDLALDGVLERHDTEVAVGVLDRLDDRHDGRSSHGVDRRRRGSGRGRPLGGRRSPPARGTPLASSRPRSCARRSEQAGLFAGESPGPMESVGRASNGVMT